MGFRLIAGCSGLSCLSCPYGDRLGLWRGEHEFLARRREKSVGKAQSVAPGLDVLKPEFTTRVRFLGGDGLLACVNEHNRYAGQARLVSRTTAAAVLIAKNHNMNVPAQCDVAEVLLRLLAWTNEKGRGRQR